MAEGFICSRFRRPASPVRQDSFPKEEPPKTKKQLDDEQSIEKRTLNIGLLSEAISSLILLPVSSPHSLSFFAHLFEYSGQKLPAY